MNEDEFIRLLHGEESKLFRIALAILGNDQDAWDSLQQSAEKAWRKRSALKGGCASFPAWIKRILVNQSLDLLKERRRLLPTDPGEMSAILDLPVKKDEYDILLIWHLVLELGPEHRKVIALRYLGDMSLQEIARELDISLGTVKSRLNTAHTCLRKKLQDNH